MSLIRAAYKTRERGLFAGAISILSSAILVLTAVPAQAVVALPSAPVSPVMSVAGLGAQSQITVMWQSPRLNSVLVTDYNVQISSNLGLNWTPFVDGVSTNTTTVITGLTPGSSYQVRVQAVSALGVSAWAIAAQKDENTVEVGAGDGFSCALQRDGSVLCWGTNGSGQLGDGTRNSRLAPVFVSGISDAIDISVGRAHTCAILKSERTVCWGDNSYGQLGDGTQTEALTPVEAAGMDGATTIAAGGTFSCAVVGGNAFCWGENLSGQLGLGNRSSQLIASNPVVGISNVTSVSAGERHACAVSGQDVKCWGANSFGQVGNNSFSDALTAVSITAPSPVAQVEVGSSHSCLRTLTGEVSCWGYNVFGQVGDNSTTTRSTPTAVSITGVLAIEVGAAFTCALLVDGTVSCWGFNAFGQLGNGTTTDAAVPTVVTGLSTIGSLSVGADHSCGLRTDGTVTCWGANYLGQLGNGAMDTTTLTPVSVQGSNVLDLDAGTGHTCAVLTDGRVECWGSNSSGQLGNGNANAQPNAQATVVPGINSAVAVSAGDQFSCAVLADGTVRCWGANGSGQLGNGTLDASPFPVIVTGISTAVSVSAGGSHACAVLSDSTTQCWGNNLSGQLGNASNVDSTVPVLVGLNGVAQISAGGSHTCAVLDDNSVLCWGANDVGQLGLGDTVSVNLPFEVSGLNAIQVSAGARHTCVVVGVGLSALCWGNNFEGQLGNGTRDDALTPETVVAVTTAAYISAGTTHTCVMLTDATVRCFGANASGQLGDGSNNRRTTSVLWTNSQRSVALAAGSDHSCRMNSAGDVVCVGANALGQLGTNEIDARPITLATAPGAPTDVTATPFTNGAVVTWTPGARNGGLITGYAVTARINGVAQPLTCSTTGAMTCTVNGLTNGTTYTFTVVATSSYGSSPASVASNAVTPAVAPNPPTSVRVVAGDGEVTVSWTASVPNSSPVLTYTAVASPSGLSCTTASVTCVVQGLTNGVTYTFTVFASAETSDSIESAPSVPVMPAGVPTRVTSLVVTRTSTSATASWQASLGNGASVTGYTVTAQPGNSTCTTFVGIDVNPTSCVLTGLDSSTVYTYSVIATNSFGNSVARAVTAPAKPAVTAVDRALQVSWLEPQSGLVPVSYTAKTTVGNLSCTTVNLTCQIVGASNGNTYFVVIRATNAEGSVAESAPSDGSTPAGVPGKPGSTTVSRTATTAHVTWVDSITNGAPVIVYTVTANPGGKTCSATTSTECTIIDLSPTTNYTYTVTATHARGVSLVREIAAVQDVFTTRGDGEVHVEWQAPVSGPAIFEYEVTAAPGGLSCITDTTDCVIDGLTNGVAYTFTVEALTVDGDAISAAPSSPVTPAGAPKQPAAPTAVKANASVTLTWAPADNNGELITEYIVTSTPGNFTCTTTSLSCTVTGLANGTAYTFSLIAKNGLGSSPASAASESVTPMGLPDAPTGISAVAGDRFVQVSWNAASNTNGQILGYTATASTGQTCSTVVGVDANPLTCQIAGLTNTKKYSFTVTARNAEGTSVASLASGIVTPFGRPIAPTSLKVIINGGSKMAVRWLGQQGNGRSITKMEFKYSTNGKTYTAWKSTAMANTAALVNLKKGQTVSIQIRVTNSAGSRLSKIFKIVAK